MEEIRINKYLSQCGFCSRREADRLLEEGRVEINGQCALVGAKVTPQDSVKVDGKPISNEAKEIVIAKMENSAVRANKDGGKDVADFFEEIYARVLALSKSEC